MQSFLFYDREMCTKSATRNANKLSLVARRRRENINVPFLCRFLPYTFQKHLFTSSHCWVLIGSNTMDKFSFLAFLSISWKTGRCVRMVENYFDPLNCQHRSPLIKIVAEIATDLREKKKVKLNNRRFNGRQIYYLDFTLPLTHCIASFRMGIFIISTT